MKMSQMLMIGRTKIQYITVIFHLLLFAMIFQSTSTSGHTSVSQQDFYRASDSWWTSNKPTVQQFFCSDFPIPKSMSWRFRRWHYDYHIHIYIYLIRLSCFSTLYTKKRPQKSFRISDRVVPEKFRAWLGMGIGFSHGRRSAILWHGGWPLVFLILLENLCH